MVVRNKILGKTLATLLALGMTLGVSACSVEEFDSTLSAGDRTSKTLPEPTTSANGEDTDAGTDRASTADGTIAETWSMEAAPNYYKVIGTASVDESTPIGTIVNSPLDAYGRTGKATATITYDMRKAGSSRERNMKDPPAWPDDNPKVEIQLDNGKAYHGYLFNRSHLIAKSLGGSDSGDNMVVGTRMQNVGDNQPAGGMAYTETLARDWLDDHQDGYIWYDVTPIYADNIDMIPIYNLVNMKTSDGSIDIEVQVFNAANGFTIDYKTGGYSKNN